MTCLPVVLLRDEEYSKKTFVKTSFTIIRQSYYTLLSSILVPATVLNTLIIIITRNYVHMQACRT